MWMCFWYALSEKGARVYRTRPESRCPASIIEIYPKFLSQTVIVAICQRTCKPNTKRKLAFKLCWDAAAFRARLKERASRIQSESLLSSFVEAPPIFERSSKNVHSRSYILSWTFSATDNTLIAFSCINNFCDRFLICGRKDRKIPDTFQEKHEIFILLPYFLTLLYNIATKMPI